MKLLCDLKKLKSWLYQQQFKILLLLLAPTPALADSGVTLDSIINNLTNYLNSTLARSVGCLAFVVAGYLCFKKQMMAMHTLFWITFGLGLIFGGAQLYSVITGMS